MTTIHLEENLVSELEIMAKHKLTTVEALVKDVLRHYLQVEKELPPKKYSFIGIGHSGKKNLSTQVEKTLEKGANRIEGWSLSE